MSFVKSTSTLLKSTCEIDLFKLLERHTPDISQAGCINTPHLLKIHTPPLFERGFTPLLFISKL